MRHPIALAVGDVHLSHDVPVARGETREEWYLTQYCYLKQIVKLSTIRRAGSGLTDCVPIIMPGDIVHTWNQPHELTSYFQCSLGPWAVAIPGNHDLPNHDPKQIRRSAYWTLCQNKTFRHLTSNPEHSHQWGLSLYGFGYGRVVEPPQPRHTGTMSNGAEKSFPRIAVIHDYIWAAGSTGEVHTRTEENHIGSWLNHLRSYDAAIFGDNHQTFVDLRPGCPTIINAGTLMSRRSDERNHEPCAVMLFNDMSIDRHYLDVSKDKWRPGIDSIAAERSGLDVDEFLETVRSLAKIGFDYKEHVRRHIYTMNTRAEVKDLIESILQEDVE